MLAVFEHESVGRAGVEPDIENVVDLLPGLAGTFAEKTLARAIHVPRVGAGLTEGLDDAMIDTFVLQDFDRAVAILFHEHGDRHAPGALPRDHPVGLRVDHAGDAVAARRRHPSRY